MILTAYSFDVSFSCTRNTSEKAPLVVGEGGREGGREGGGGGCMSEASGEGNRRECSRSLRRRGRECVSEAKEKRKRE